MYVTSNQFRVKLSLVHQIVLWIDYSADSVCCWIGDTQNRFIR